MILHPGILALTCGTALVLLMMIYASALAVKIVLRWDFSSSSEEQLVLERKSYLVSTIVNYALGFEVLSLFLFIFTLDEIHSLFVGAMCATGSLNANPIGWYALYAKIVAFFAAALWIALNYLDGKAEDFPLVKTKFRWLLLLTPLIGLELYLQVAYFLGLHPEIITSCCGSLFSSAGNGIAAELAGLPAKSMMVAFYAAGVLFLLGALPCLRRPSASFRYLFTLLAALFFTLAIAAIVSFISLYIYELPTHHCPFDIFQKNYHFIGYPLYLCLFGGTLFGLMPGLFQGIKRIPSLKQEMERMEKKWVLLAVLLISSFILIVSWPILFGHFKLADYPSFIF
ncbi:MAG: hypothetical protein A2X84_03580 [Desulfuromonadaceae bacterium GWC2_58_13]|nr:MAG: hypothetical protein A2X84_03580 [Desulfuromonadaceae bacterium GWC2_58_13]